MSRLLIVHHSPTPGLERLLDAVVAGTAADGIHGVDVELMAALDAKSSAVLAADAYLLGTPANLGYMSGALKHFFDVVYNDALPHSAGRPYGCWVHGESDTTGAILGIEKIVTGLQWRIAQPPLSLIGAVDDAMEAQAWELGAAVAALTMSAH